MAQLEISFLFSNRRQRQENLFKLAGVAALFTGLIMPIIPFANQSGCVMVFAWRASL
jgi:hypothetical protein